MHLRLRVTIRDDVLTHIAARDHRDDVHETACGKMYRTRDGGLLEVFAEPGKLARKPATCLFCLRGKR